MTISAAEAISGDDHAHLSPAERRNLKRRQAIEPMIGHLKGEHRLARCWLKGATGDALHTVLCAAGYNLRWLMRAVLRLGLKVIFLALRSALLRRASWLAQALQLAQPPRPIAAN